MRNLKAISEKVNTILGYSIDMFAHNSKEHIQDIMELENEIDEMERQFQKNHVERLTKNECTAASGMIFSDAISGFERVADHATNIAYALLEQVPDDDED